MQDTLQISNLLVPEIQKEKRERIGGRRKVE